MRNRPSSGVKAIRSRTLTVGTVTEVWTDTYVNLIRITIFIITSLLRDTFVVGTVFLTFIIAYQTIVD